MAVADEVLFRKVALQRLSTPDQLDQTLRVTSSKSWVALLALVLLIGAAGVWVWRGEVATTVTGQAVIVRTGGMISVTSQGAGQIVWLGAGVGDKVKANQVIARIAQPSLMERIHAAQDALAEARREGRRSVGVRSESSKLQVAAIDRDRANLRREISEFTEQAKLAEEQIPIEEQLLAKGLNTKQQVIEAKQKLISIQAQVARHRAQLTQLDAQQYSIESAPAQVDAEAQGKVSDLERRLSELVNEMSLAANVVTPYAGSIVEVKVQSGSIIGAGASLLTVQPAGNDLEALVYIPAEWAKEVTPGMEARISPSTVKREEYGYLKAKVLTVAEFPATEGALMRNLQNETLVKSLQNNGPVTEMRAVLEKDPTTPTGFKWSSSKGPRMAITAGSISTTQIATRHQTPMSLLFPVLRRKLGI